MLIALEELVLHNRRGWFALAVALNAVVNYFFFVGQVTFVILYFFLRFADKNWRMTLSRFLGVALEAGAGGAACRFYAASFGVDGNGKSAYQHPSLWIQYHSLRPYPTVSFYYSKHVFPAGASCPAPISSQTTVLNGPLWRPGCLL